MVKKNGLLKELRKEKDLMKGSLAQTQRRCGKKKCKCQKGALHQGYFFSYVFKGKPHVVYIPKNLVGKVQTLTENWKMEKSVIEEITHLNAGLIKKRKI